MRVLTLFLMIAPFMGCESQSEEAKAIEESLGVPRKESFFEQVSPPTVSKKTSTAQTLPPESSVEEETETPVRSLDEMLLFFPSRYPEGNWEPDDLHYEDVWFESADGTKLHGWYCPVEKPVAVMLFAHGNGGHLAHRAELLKFLQTELQVSVMMFDYRGYGRSKGVPTVKGILQDARAAANILAEKADVLPEELVLIGRSLGGAVMIDLAAELQPSGLIVECTFPSLKEVASIHYRKLSWLVPAGKLNSAERLAEYQGPFLQSHGTLDRIIPYDLGQKLYEAANEPKQFVSIPEGNHNTPQSVEYYEALNKFLASLRE